ncbi:hypothetical protein [Nonomuraea sp. B19D2]
MAFLTVRADSIALVNAARTLTRYGGQEPTDVTRRWQSEYDDAQRRGMS